jgi:hypothetical protein
LRLPLLNGVLFPLVLQTSKRIFEPELRILFILLRLQLVFYLLSPILLLFDLGQFHGDQSLLHGLLSLLLQFLQFPLLALDLLA